MKKRIHLDYAATTPVHKDVFSVMQTYFSDVWANPSALYKEGVATRTVIEKHRSELAQTLRVRPGDITFTSGGTEANNMALIGTIEEKRKSGTSYEEMEVITTRIEHPSILETVHYLENRGVKIVYAEITNDGYVDMTSFGSLLTSRTVLVTFAYVNSEIGVVQDIKKISRIVRKWNEAHQKDVWVHTDASQAPLWLPCALDMLGVDLMTLDAGKCYGPKGVGVLIHRHWVKLAPIIFGGGQEIGLRSGTENTPLIVGCVRALVRAQESQEARSKKTSVLRNEFFALLEKNIEGVVINGGKEMRVANNVNISIPGEDTEFTVMVLDAKGVACATRSACGGEGGEGSHVVREMTGDDARAMSTIRFSLGEDTTLEEISFAVNVLSVHIEQMRRSLGAHSIVVKGI